MSHFITIEGGAPLVGSVEISGSKNAALPIMAAAAFSNGSEITNMPDIMDCHVFRDILESSFRGGIGLIDSRERLYDQIRASYYSIPPMLYHAGFAVIRPPGGCPLNRTFEGVIKCVEKFGFIHKKKFSDKEDPFDLPKTYSIEIYKAKENLPKTVSVDCRVTKSGGHQISSVGITMMSILMSKLVEETKILFPANDPEIHCLLEVMEMLGAEIKKDNSSFFIKSERKANNFSYTLPPDRIEAGTYALASLITDGNIFIKNYPHSHLQEFTKTLDLLGADIVSSSGDVGPLYIKRGNNKRPQRHHKIICDNYPAFPTDLQPLLAVWAALQIDSLEIQDRIYEYNRFKYIKILEEMGFKYRYSEDCTVLINRIEKFNVKINFLKISDLRGGMAVLLAMLTLNQRKSLSGAEVLKRGYEKYIDKLSGLGAVIYNGYA